MSHPYNSACHCEKERNRRAAQALNDPRRLFVSQKPKKKRVPRERFASREEQYARYIDCGPGAWDDRE